MRFTIFPHLDNFIHKGRGGYLKKTRDPKDLRMEALGFNQIMISVILTCHGKENQ